MLRYAGRCIEAISTPASHQLTPSNSHPTDAPRRAPSARMTGDHADGAHHKSPGTGISRARSSKNISADECKIAKMPGSSSPVACLGARARSFGASLVSLGALFARRAFAQTQ
jgi:hypothetical protein